MSVSRKLTISLAICLLLFSFSVFSCGKKEPEAPKPPQKKIELPPPKPPESLRQEVEGAKEPRRPKETEAEIGEKPVQKMVVGKKAPKTSTKRPDSGRKKRSSPRVAGVDELNHELKARRLNVWSSDLGGEGVVVSGYVKTERERQEALNIARRYYRKITDNISLVVVYDNTIKGSGR